MSKRKLPAYEVISEDERPDLYAVMRELLEEHHDELAGAVVQLVWRRNWKSDKDDRLILGKAIIPGRVDRLTHGIDLRVLLNYEVYNSVNFSREQQRALIDHELQHFAPALDDDTLEQKVGADGLLEWRLRKHNLEEFREIVARHGQWKSDIQDFVRTAMEAGIPEQLTLSDREGMAGSVVGAMMDALENPAGAPSEMRRSIEALANSGDGIDGVTITAGGRSVTLHKPLGKPH